MNATKFYSALYIVSLILFGTCFASATFAQQIFKDDFETGDFSHSENGFSWSNPNDTFVGPYGNSPNSSGTNSMLFRYATGDPWSEQRFFLGGAYPEVWFKFWLKVPDNYAHHPTGAANNRKIISVWMDGYSGQGDGSTIWIGFHSTSSGGSTFAVTHSRGRHVNSSPFQQNKPFISYPADQGRWMQIVLQSRVESSTDADDGFIKVWRRWQGEESFTQTHDVNGLRIRMPDSGPQGFAAGYMMGWANDAYPVQTEFLIDDFTVSSTSLLNQAPAPRPPVDLH